MEAEGQFKTRMKSEGGPRPSDYMMVEDNGADTTIIAFAGIAILYAGMPQFEFYRMLKRIKTPCNFIMVRDIHRSAYCLAPDGGVDGPGFYENAINEALAKLNSKYNVALGASAGGAAAFFFSGKVPIHHIITFSPGFPVDVYTNIWTRLRVLFDARALIREPGAYAEVLLVTFGASFYTGRIRRLTRGNTKRDALESYLSARPQPPRVTLFYGEHCLPDRKQAESLRHIDTIQLRPLPTGRHNCASYLHKKGILISTLNDEVDRGKSASFATSTNLLKVSVRPLQTANEQG